MTILRILILPFVLLAAACGTRWVAVAPGTATIECTAIRLAARGWIVDTVYTNHRRIRVILVEEGGLSVDTVTAQLLSPPATSYVRMESRWWYGEGAARRHMGMVGSHRIEMRNALKSCGVDAWGYRPMPPLVECAAGRLAARGFEVDTLQPNVILATFRRPSRETVVRVALLPPNDRARMRVTSELFAVDDVGRRAIGTDSIIQGEVREVFSGCGVFGYTNRPAWKGPLPGRGP
jgi:hypothetical protein